MDTYLCQPQTLFGGAKQYEVPEFQRRYVWQQEEQWEPLWEDVTDLAQSLAEGGASEAHFMGAVVLEPVRFRAGMIDRRVIVDGQQRLITLQLLIDAVQEVLAEQGHQGQAARLSTLVENPPAFHFGEPNNAFKVWPAVVDRAAFRHAMRNDLSAAAHAASSIVQAHDYFKVQVGEWLSGFDDRAKGATALEEALQTKLEVVVIDLGGSDDAHVIFETLNARGTPLLQSDMIKNRVLYDVAGRSGENNGGSSEERQLWPFGDDWWSAEVGRGLQRRPRIDVFLNHWLTLRNRSETKPRNEFRVFVDYAEKQSQGRSREDTVRGIARDIGTLGRLYRDVEEKSRPEIITSFLERRNVMGVTVVTPLVLTLLSSGVPEATLVRCVRAVESFLVRRVVCGYSTRSYGALFIGLLKKLTESTAAEDRVVVEYLAEQTALGGRWPDDSELLDRFVTAPLYQIITQGRLRMVLAGIEEQLRTSMVESQKAPQGLHIEHIMPQAWHGADWPLPGGTERFEATANRDRAIHTIGNLTLVNDRLNPSLSNGSWHEKKEKLAKYSVLHLNKDFGRVETWHEQAIEARARQLHDRAIEVWPHADGFVVG